MPKTGIAFDLETVRDLPVVARVHGLDPADDAGTNDHDNRQRLLRGLPVVADTSHHDKASITYMDVKDVAADLHRLRTSVEKVHEQFRLHRWREPLAAAEPGASNVVPLRPLAKPAFAVHVCPDIAAFVRMQVAEVPRRFRPKR